MADTRITRVEREITALRNIEPDSNGQNKFILDELPLDRQDQASSLANDIFICRLQSKSNIYTQSSILIHIILKPTFPMEPPGERSITKVYHPNVSEQGEVWIDLLNPVTSWTPATSLVSVIEKMIQNIEAAILYATNCQKYERVATDTFNENCSPRF